jgi:hypothetical protein
VGGVAGGTTATTTTTINTTNTTTYYNYRGCGRCSMVIMGGGLLPSGNPLIPI